MENNSENNININFKPSSKQAQALYKLMKDDRCKFVGYGGSAFSGKSYLMCYWLVMNCYAYPGTAWGLARKELVNLKKTTLQTLFKVFNECNITEDDYTYNQQLNTITFNNESVIYLIDTAYKPSDPLYQRFGGFELTGCGIDESAETNEGAINILFTRCGRKLNRKYGLTAKILETFNPNKNHVYRRYYKPFTEGNLKRSYAFIKALPSDNPSPEVNDYISNIIENSDETTIQRLIHGNFEYDDDPSSLVNYNNILNIFNNQHIQLFKDNKLIGTQTHDNKQLTEKYITCDVARLGKDSTIVLVWHGLKIIEYKKYTKQTLDVTSEKIKEIQREHNIPTSNIIVDSDGVGGGLVDMLKGCIPFQNGSAPLHKENYTNIKTQCYYYLAKQINNKNIYFETINNTDKDIIISELELIKAKNIDNDGKKDLISKETIKERLGRSPDFADAIMMRMYIEIKNSKTTEFSFYSF